MDPDTVTADSILDWYCERATAAGWHGGEEPAEASRARFRRDQGGSHHVVTVTVADGFVSLTAAALRQ